MPRNENMIVWRPSCYHREHPSGQWQIGSDEVVRTQLSFGVELRPSHVLSANR
jgi:hypothetical protein